MSLNQCNANKVIIFKACRGTQQHEEVQLGLLYGILTDPKMAPKVYITAMICCFIYHIPLRSMHLLTSFTFSITET